MIAQRDRYVSVFLLLAALMAGVSTPLSAQATIQLPSEKDIWLAGKSPNFEIITNSSEQILRRTLRELEEFRSALGSNSTGMDVRSPLPSQIYLFKNETSFSNYKLMPDGKPNALLAGYFQPALEANYIAIDESQGMRVVYNEFVHYFTDNNVPDMPLWMKQGLAEFYSTFEIKEGRQRIGLHFDAHVRLLRDTKIQPVLKLFAVKNDSPEYNDIELARTFHAQSWALVHYLVVSDVESRVKFSKYSTAIAHGGDPGVLFWDIFETDPETLDAKLKTYVHQDRFNYFYLESVDLPESSITIHPLSYVETLTRLGDLVAHRRPLDAARAKAHLGKVLELAPGHGPALLALARIHEDQEQWEKAASFYEKARLAKPPSPEATAALGAWMIRSWQRTDRSARIKETPPALLEARALLQKALALDPNQSEAIQNLGKTYFLGEQATLEEGLAYLHKAIETFPHRGDLIADLIITLASSGRVSEATEWFDGAYTRREHSRNNIVRVLNHINLARVKKAVAVANGGNVSEALEMLSAIDTTGSPAFTKRVEDLTALLRARLK